MKKSPDMAKLEAVLRSSKIAAGGFMGSDERGLEEIIEADAAELERLGRTASQVAARMEEISRIGRKGLGTSVDINGKLVAIVEESRGIIICPWPHPAGFRKTVTIAKRTDTGRSATWSDLSIHMIRVHGFFEGRGSSFRLEPKELIEVIF